VQPLLGHTPEPGDREKQFMPPDPHPYLSVLALSTTTKARSSPD
jgi:hypothetical protein